MKKFFEYAMMAMMMMGSAVILNACGDDDKDAPDSGEIDTRIDNVVPKDIRKNVEKYMAIYDGVNPPNVEGTYLMSKAVLVYDSENYYEAGHDFRDMYFKFANQNSKNNTIDYDEKQGNGTQSGKGAFISGSGKNFSIYMNTTGYDGDLDVSYKLALVVSGAISSDGISGIKYAFIMVDKSGSGVDDVMEIGDYRVITDQDGLAENHSWPAGSRMADLTDGNSDFVRSIILK